MTTGALQSLIDKYTAWTPGIGGSQSSAWQPNANDPSAAMFGIGAPHIYWQPSPGSDTPQSVGSSSSSGDQGLPGGSSSGAGGALGAGSTGSTSGGALSGTPNFTSGDQYDQYLNGLASANNIGSSNGWSSGGWQDVAPFVSPVASTLAGLLGGPLAALGTSLLLKPSSASQAANLSSNSQGAMGMQLPGDLGMTDFTPDGVPLPAAHPDDLHNYSQDNGSAYGGNSGGGSAGGGSSSGSGNSYGGYGSTVSFDGGGVLRDETGHHPIFMASGGSVAQVARPSFGAFMSGPMRTDPRTAQFADELKQAMGEMAAALKGDPQAAKVKAYFQANFVEPVEEALAKKDAAGAMRLCVAMMNEAHAIVQGK